MLYYKVMKISFTKKLIILSLSGLALLVSTGNTFAQEAPKDDTKTEVQTRRYERDLKAINDRILKNKDDYTVSVRQKFINNADKLASIAAKIETRIAKLEIAGEDVSGLKADLNSAEEIIKETRNSLRSLPQKQSAIDYTASKKYASIIVDARNNLEQAKELLTKTVSGLKDFVVEKDNDEKN